MPKQPLDPSIIDNAPLSNNSVEADEDYTDYLFQMLIRLQTELDESQAEVERLKGSKTFNQVKAEMLKPYADAVFRFVMWYCVAVGIIIISAGNKKWTGFELPEMILGIISGSTAISVIGLIGMVISGLFSGAREAAEK